MVAINIAVLQNDAKYTIEGNTCHQCLHTALRRIKNCTEQRWARRDRTLSLLCIEADMLRLVDFKDMIKDFALAKSRKWTF